MNSWQELKQNTVNTNININYNKEWLVKVEVPSDWMIPWYDGNSAVWLMCVIEWWKNANEYTVGVFATGVTMSVLIYNTCVWSFLEIKRAKTVLVAKWPWHCQYQMVCYQLSQHINIHSYISTILWMRPYI